MAGPTDATGSGLDAEVPAGIRNGMVALGLATDGAVLRGRPLTGGVSSDIWLVERPGGTVVVKRALERLRVDADWVAPTSRTGFEAAWLSDAAASVPGSAVTPLGFDPDTGVLALEWLDPVRYRNWKAVLSAGPVSVRDGAEVAVALGDRLGAIHAALSDRDRFAGRFAAADLFRALRLDPYLAVTAAAHPDLAPTLERLAERTAVTGLTVIHGDVSPKNVLVGPDGPVLLDAECATWGDPAFDVAFCLTHLLLKAVWHPDDAAALRRAADAFVAAYLDHVLWESADSIEHRVATLVPALALARVDGASPVEYLDEPARARMRSRARELLRHSPADLATLLAHWFEPPTPAPPAPTPTPVL